MTVAVRECSLHVQNVSHGVLALALFNGVGIDSEFSDTLRNCLQKQNLFAPTELLPKELRWNVSLC